MRDIAWVAGSLVALAVSAQAASLTRFDRPDGAPTCGTAIASDGAIAGGPVGAAGGPVFVYQNGSFSYPAPAMPQGQLVVTGLNRFGTLLGYDQMSPPGIGLSFASFKLRQGKIVVVQHPYTAWTIATGLNDAGAIVGTLQASPAAPGVGFLSVRGVWTTLDDASGAVFPAAIDADSRRVVGSSYNVLTGQWRGWSYAAGAFATIAVPGAAATFPHGVDTNGRIVGHYVSGGATQTTHGFVYAGGVYTTLDMPDAEATELSGLNQSGQFTGCFTDQTGIHGLAGQL